MADDWLNIALRFALYPDLTILFGVSPLGVQALRPDHRALATVRRYVCTVGTTVALGILLSLWSVVVMAKAMTDATEYGALTSHIFGMILTTTTVRLAWIVHLVALVNCLVIVAWLAERPMPYFGLCAGLGTVALVAVIWAKHGAVHDGVTGYLHLVSNIVRVLAAGAWVGALTVFVFLASMRHTVSTEMVEILSYISNGLARLGALVIATLLVTGMSNYWLIVGPTLNGLFSSLYRRLLLFKLALFRAMLGLIAVNRYQLNSQLGTALDVDDHSDAVIALRRSLCMEAGLTVVILVTVAWFGVLSPPGAQAILTARK